MDINKLKGVVPDAVIAEIPSVMEKFNINTSFRLSHFLGQCAAESGNFKVFAENLNYSAKGLVATFPKYFPTIESTNGYANNPEKIANKTYGSRMGNASESSGLSEGYKYSGRGAIMITGKTNYALFDDFVPENILENPTLVKTKYPILSAAWFFSRNGLNAVADLGMGDDVILKMTKKINGGTIGLDHRKEYTKKFYELLK